MTKLAGHRAPEFLLSLPSHSGFTDMYGHAQLYVCTGDPNSDFCACKASTLPTEPSSQSLKMVVVSQRFV